jgi:hypothetical protein
MSAPNVVAPSAVHVQSAPLVLGTSIADILSAVPTGHAYNVDAIFCCNANANVRRKVTATFKTGGVEYDLALNTPIPVGQTINILYGKPLYLAEGDSLRLSTDGTSGGGVTAIAAYVDIIA